VPGPRRATVADGSHDGLAGEPGLVGYSYQIGGVEMISEHHRVEATIDVPVTDVVAVLAARPSTWLATFLRLAIQIGAGQAATTVPSRYRLDPPATDDRDEVWAAPFRWRPYRDEDTFEVFSGTFTVAVNVEKTTIGLNGDAVGGTFARNDEVLRALLSLIALAIRADQEASEEADQELDG
jgi:hypothetical protein